MAVLIFGLSFVQFILLESINNNADIRDPLVEDIGRDWLTQPFTDLVAADGAKCPTGYERVFSSQWQGTFAGCKVYDFFYYDVMTYKDYEYSY